MVLTHTTNHTYSHPFPTVTLAYFLRYCSPQINPFAAHVLSTDTISSHVDPATGRLHTTRIHLKKSRIPSAIVKLLPASLMGGAGPGGEKASYILETSVVDIREGWLRSESRNLDHVSVLSVVEQQTYTAPSPPSPDTKTAGTTDVATTTIFRSRVGERIRDRLGQQQQQSQQPPSSDAGQEGSGWLARLSARGVQRSIESIASSRTQTQISKSREGMGMVIERIRQAGYVSVLEMRRRAREGLDMT
ncbi:hypothetical protein P8C59_002949 [Phyllachora maydis]|uniref:PRELI/MSF1 domain-containing protein n=1 Tax=Phyllachora maydis TaxID=1825666 RepID=A0AAD9HZG9_9PEZI|nr:hypothetical protein P8C59_002949 [Phyllachora maydis]